jgi:hypothetical protein
LLAQSILAVAQRNFRSLQGVPVEVIVLLSTIPGYPEQDQVELSKEIWSTVSTVVQSVTIALESGASLSVLLNDDAASAAAAIDRICFVFVLLPSRRNASLEHAASLIGLARLQGIKDYNKCWHRRDPSRVVVPTTTDWHW